AIGEGIANLNRTVVVQTDDVAGHCVFSLLTIASDEGHGVAHAHVFTKPHVTHLHALFIGTRTDAHESDAVAMFWIHVRLNLEHETGERRFLWCDFTRLGRSWLWRRRPLHEVVKHLFHTEIAECGAEEHRSQFAREISFKIELMARAAHQFDFHAEVVSVRPEILADFVA